MLKLILYYSNALIRFVLQTGLWICLFISAIGLWNRAGALKDLLLMAKPELYFLGLVVWQLTFITVILCLGFLLLYLKGRGE